MINIDDSLRAEVIGKSRYLNRLLRLRISNFNLFNSEVLFFIYNRGIYRYDIKNEEIQRAYSIKRGREQLQRSLTTDTRGNVYFGEYWSNRNREKVNLLKGREYGKKWEVIHSFPEDSIRHIHSVQYDTYSDRLWMTTGDKPWESLILYSEDGGRTFKSIGKGSKMWTTVSLIFTDDYIYWGTDNPWGHNFICRWQRKNRTMEKITSVKGPVYYGKKVGEYILFSTAVEKGVGEQDCYSRIYGIDNSLNCYELFKMKKDSLAPDLYGYGTMEFNRGYTDSSRFWVNTTGLIEDGASIQFEISE